MLQSTPKPRFSYLRLILCLAFTGLTVFGSIDSPPPAPLPRLTILSAQTRGNPNAVTVSFSRPVSSISATNATNYVISPGVIVQSVTQIEATKVRLNTSLIAVGQVYTLLVEGILDTDSPPRLIEPNTRRPILQTDGGITRREFHDIGGGTLADMTNHTKFLANKPDLAVFTPSFEAPTDIRENYGVQFLGYVTAPVTGDYIFYVNSDDQGALFLSTDEAPANKRLIASEPQWNSTRSWIAGGNASSRYPTPNDAFFSNAVILEAEDFDFDRGQFVAGSATGMSGVYTGGAYSGRGTSADADIDWHDGDLRNEGSEYRAGVGVDIGPQASAQDRLRGVFSVRENFAVGWCNTGDWMNYTREFPEPAKSYHVFARLASGGSDMSAQLDEVTAGRGTTTQAITELGKFKAPSTGNWGGFAFVPLRNADNQVARVSLGGRRTLRFTTLPGNLNVDYLLFVPAGPGEPDLDALRPVNSSAPIHLEAGHRYFIEAQMKEAGGGDNLAVTWRKPGDPEIVNGAEPIRGEFLSGVEPLAAATLIAQPQSLTVDEHSSATFTVALGGTPPYDFQWYRNGEMLVGENTATLTLTAVPAALSGATFHVVVGNGLSSLRSEVATLTVVPDLAPPQFLFAESRAGLEEVGVGFSEPIDPADAADVRRYRISDGVNVLSATLWSNQRLVVLKTTALTPGQVYTVTISDLHDRATSRNVIAPGSRLSFKGFDLGEPLPPLPAGFQRVTVTTRTGPVTVVIPRREFRFEPAAQTYYLAAAGDDFSAGTITQPWRTFAHALEKLEPGDLLYVREGDYPEPFVVRKSGSLGRPIIISAYPGERARVYPPAGWEPLPGTTHGANTIQIDASHIWVHGLLVQGPPRELGYRPLGTPVLSAIQLGGGGEGCRILNTTCYQAQYSGIKDQTGSIDYLVEGNICFDNGTPVDEAYPAGAGLYLPGAARSGTIIRGNALFRNGRAGFSHYHRPIHHHVYNNVIFDNGTERGSFGMVTSGQFSFYAHNVIADNNAYGFSFYDASGEGQANDNSLMNSMILGETGWLLEKGFDGPNGNTIAYTILHPASQWATHEPRITALLGPGVLFADPIPVSSVDRDYRVRVGSPARWAAGPVPLLGTWPQTDIGLFPATAYWEPELERVPDQTAIEGVPLTFPLKQISNLPASTQIRYILGDLSPTGAALDPLTGVFTWTPNEFQGGSSYRITVIAQAENSPVLYGARTFTVNVLEGNRAPLLGFKTAVTNSVLTSVDLHEVGAPWVPGSTELISDGGYRMTAHGGGIIRDKGWTDLIRYAYTEVNGDFDAQVRVERLTPVGVFTGAGIMVRENLDVASQMHFAFVMPTGLTEQLGLTGLNAYSINFRSPSGDWRRPAIEASREVPYPDAWIRVNRQGNTFRSYRSQDGVRWTELGTLNASYSPTIYLGLAVDAARWETNAVAVAEFRQFQIRSDEPKPVASVTVDENTGLALPMMATDSDRPGQELTYSIQAGEVSGATINPRSGLLTWTPTEAQGPGAYPFTVRVVDSGQPPLSAEHSFMVHVSEVNSRPVIAPIGDRIAWADKLLSFVVGASDPADIPENKVSLRVGELPTGATFDAVSRVFAWTPTREQGGVHTITFTAADDGVPSASAELSVSIQVLVNHPPVLGIISDQVLVEGNTLRLDLGLADIGTTPGIRREVFNAVNGLTVADLTNSARFPKQPSSFAIRSSFEAPRDVGDNYGQRMRGYIVPPETGDYTFWIASDDASTLLLSTDVNPTHARPIASVVTWTDYRQWTKEPNQQSVPIRLVAGQPLYVEALMKEGGGGDHLTVRWMLPTGAMETPIPGTRLIAWAQEPKRFAEDPDLPSQALSYSLEPGAPPGMTIDPVTGRLSWSTSEEHGPGSYPITIRVTDDGEPPQSATQTVIIQVTEMNQAPVLVPVPDQTVIEGEPLVLVLSASDGDLPKNTLAFSLDQGAPEGIDFTRAGVLTWTPSATQGGRTYPIDVTVTDDGKPSLSDHHHFNVTVEAKPRPIRIEAARMGVDGSFSFTWDAQQGRSYQVQFKEQLTDPGWINHGSPIVANGDRATFSTLIQEISQRFYRVTNGP